MNSTESTSFPPIFVVIVPASPPSIEIAYDAPSSSSSVICASSFPSTSNFTPSADEKERHENMKTKVMDEVKRLFKPEFINRIDEIIVFHALNKEQIGSIVDIMIAKVNKRIMEQMKISIELNDEAKKYIVDKGYDEKYGARPLRRTIQNDIEDALAEKILEGTVKQGNRVLVSVKDGKLHFSLKRGINK